MKRFLALFPVVLLLACNTPPSRSSSSEQRSSSTAGSPVRTPVKTGTRLARYDRLGSAPLAQRAGGAVPSSRPFALTPAADNSVHEVLDDGTTVTGTWDPSTGALDLVMSGPDGSTSHVVGTLVESPDGSSTSAYTVDTTAPDGSSGHWVVTGERTVAAGATTTVTHASGRLDDGRGGSYDLVYVSTEVVRADGSSTIDESIDDVATAASPDQSVHAELAPDGSATMAFSETDADGAAHACTLRVDAAGAVVDATCDGQPVDACAFDGECGTFPGDPQPQDCSALSALPGVLAPAEAGFQLGQAGDFPPGYDRIVMLVDEAHDGLFAALVPTGTDLAAGAVIPLAPVSWQGSTAPAAGFFLATTPCDDGRFVDGGTLALRLLVDGAGRRLAGSADYTLDGAPGSLAFDVPVASWSGDAPAAPRP